MGALDTALKVGGVGLAAGIASGLATPDETEGAVVSDAALNYGKQLWKKANVGKKLSSFQEENIANWAKNNITQALGVSSSAVEKTDSALLNQALIHPNFPDLQASHINNLRAETAAIPDILHETIDPSFKFLPADTSPFLQGRYSYRSKSGSAIAYNPQATGGGVKTSGHEFGYHAATYDPKAESLLSPKTLEDVKLMRAIDAQHDIARKSLYEGSASLTPDQEDQAFHLYYSMPGEIGARKMGSLVSEAVAARGESLKAVKDPKAYMEVLSDIADKANSRAASKNPDLYSYGFGKLAVPAAVGTGLALTANDLMASHEPAMSNIDKTVDGQDVSRFEPVTGFEPTAEKQNISRSLAAGVEGVNHEEEAKKFFLPANVMLGNPEDGLVSKNLINFIKDNPVTNLVKDVGRKVGELASGTNLFDSGKGASEYMKTHDVLDPISTLADISGGSALAPGASKGLGAIQMQGFFSPLTKALKEGVIGKSQLSPRMSGEQVLKTLQSAGIKDDELMFSGVGEALSAIGKDRIGPTKMTEIGKIAEEGALGFSKKESPGIHSSYSLFSEGDPSFKNAVYSYPGVKFEEGHFGEGAVAHRRFGDKEISTIPITSYHRGKVSLDDYNNQVKTNSLHLDEVQSQFHEKGSKFGYGEPKGVPSLAESDKYKFAVEYLDDDSDWARKELTALRSTNPNEVFAAEQYRNSLVEGRTVDRSTPKGFAKGLELDNTKDTLTQKYFNHNDQSVENVPLRGEKYVELLAKDHLRDALSSGKDAISWTPSEVQHERYYKNLKDLSWKFDNTDGKSIINLLDKNGNMLERATDLEKIKRLTGNENSKVILSDLAKGKTEGDLGNLTKDVYQKLYDRAIPKSFEKLTGEKPREGFVKGRNGEDVKIQWIPLDKVKEKLVKPGWLPVGQEIKPGMIKVKDLPIAHSQEVLDFFNPRGAQQVNV